MTSILSWSLNRIIVLLLIGPLACFGRRRPRKPDDRQGKAQHQQLSQRCDPRSAFPKASPISAKAPGRFSKSMAKSRIHFFPNDLIRARGKRRRFLVLYNFVRKTFCDDIKVVVVFQKRL